VVARDVPVGDIPPEGHKAFVDTTPPNLVLPASVVAEATNSLGSAVSYLVSATDLVSGVTAVTCQPASGSAFAIGSTAVNCSSTDAAGNVATGAFNAVVRDTTAPAVQFTSPSADTLTS